MKSKRILSGLMAFLMVTLLLAGCGGTAPAASDTPATSASAESSVSASPEASASTEASAPVAKDPLEKYAEPVKITAVLGFRPPEDSKTPTDITPETQSFIKALKDKTNIELSFLWTCPTDQFEQKFGVAVASNDLPDVMMVGLNQYENFRQNDMIQDVSKVYEDFAGPVLRKYMEADGGVAMNYLRDGEKLFGVPMYNDPKQSTQVIWARQDWLQKLNLNPPKTIEEMEKVAEAFVKQDPDGNGQADTIGLAMQKKPIYWGFDLRGLFQGYGATPGMWEKGADGKLVPGEILPSTKEALSVAQRWYKMGLFDKEFALKDEGKVVEDIVAGKIGLMYGEWWYPNWPLNTQKDKDPNAVWQCYPIVGPAGKDAKSMINPMRLDNVNVVNTKCANPEALVKILNFYNDFSDVGYGEAASAAGGFVYNWVPVRVYDPVINDTKFEAVNQALKDGKDVTGTGIVEFDDALKSCLKYKLDNKDSASWGIWFSRIAENGGWGLTMQLEKNGLIARSAYNGPVTATMTENGASLEKLRDETYIKLIMGQDLATFDDFVKTWNDLGGAAITQEVNEWAASHSK